MNGILRENMRNILLLLSTIFAIILAGADNPTKNQAPRSVNVALETSFLFEPNDINDNISFIKNIKVFLDKLYSILTPQTSLSETEHYFRADATRKFTFGEFFQNIGENIANFTETNVNIAVTVIKEEFENLANKSKEVFDKIIPNRRFRAYVKDTVKHWAKTDAYKLRENLRRTMDEMNPVLISFARRMDDYYNDDDVRRLHKMFRKFNRYLENHMEPSKVVQEFFKFAILDKHQELNTTMRANLIKDLNILLEYVTSTKKFKARGDNKSIVLKRKEPLALSFVIGDGASIVEANDSNSDDDDNKPSIETRKAFEKHPKTSNDSTKNKDRKKSVVTNEIIVDNLELIVKPIKKP